jgi:transcriptional regulator of acetoin/glycerol metabolism
MERAMIERALAANDGNRTAAARQLGIDPSTLFRKLKRIGKGV